MSFTNSKKKISSKPTTIEELSQDQLFEILHRLPFSSLLQCKSVNKRFQGVISDPLYLHSRLTHRQSSPTALETNTICLLFHFHSGCNYHDKIHFSHNSNNKTHILKGSNFLPRSWPQDRDSVRVKATHHDLLLCCSQSDGYVHYFVCNPFTKQYVALPPLRKSCPHELSRVGFMCDQSRSRFRVIHIPIVCFERVESFKVNMFSSETGKWGASIVPFPGGLGTIMSNSCFRNILVNNEKFVWWIKDRFLVCDPFIGKGSSWRVLNTHIPSHYYDSRREYDIYYGICNGRVKILEFLAKSSEFGVHELVNFEQGQWSSHTCFLDREISINTMKLLVFHPYCEDMVYLYSKKGIFLCNYKKHTLKSVYTAVDEDLRVWGNVMSLILHECPTPVPTLNIPKV